jgi:hypothetical protein
MGRIRAACRARRSSRTSAAADRKVIEAVGAIAALELTLERGEVEDLERAYVPHDVAGPL